MSLLKSTNLRRSLNPLPSVLSKRSKADKKAVAKTVSKKGGPPPDMPGDSKTDTLKKDLYPSGTTTETPRSLPRPDRLENVLYLTPTPEVHDTIARASKLHDLQSIQTRLAALRSKHMSIFTACEELRISYPAYYALASEEGKRPGDGGPADSKDMFNLLKPTQQGRGRVEGFFPKEMRVFTETAGRDGWDYEWKWVPEEKAKEKVVFEYSKGSV